MSDCRGIVSCLVAAALLLSPSVAPASSLLPLSTQEVRTLPNGAAEVVLSVGYFDALWFPAFTEPGEVCCQSLLAAPTLGFNIGLGDRVEVQASYELLLLDETILGEGESSNFGSGDARLFTKVRIWSEEGWRPAFGARFGAKLPNANRGDHLGTDRVDWGGELLGSKEIGPTFVHLNAGLQIWDNPGASGGQDDLFSYAVGVTSHELDVVEPFSLRLLGEIAGLTGSRFGNDRSAFRGGLQLRHGAFTFFGGVSAGLIRESEDIGGLIGAIWTFQVF
jgi:hypothetical protein